MKTGKEILLLLIFLWRDVRMNIIVLVLLIALPTLLFPNGHQPLKILHKLAKKEFGDTIGECSDYISLKNEVILSLKNGGSEKAEERKLETLVIMEHYKLYDFLSYLPVKFLFIL